MMYRRRTHSPRGGPALLLLAIPLGLGLATCAAPAASVRAPPLQTGTTAATAQWDVGAEIASAFSSKDETPPPEGSDPRAVSCSEPAPRNLVLGRRGEIIRGDPELALIALTFDAGAGVGTIHELLDVLASRGVRSTFFVAGGFADRYPQVVARMAEEDHELANHSYSHPDFRRLSEDQMREELRWAASAIERAAGLPIVPLWRPPFGGRDDRVLRVVEEEGYRSVYWTFDSGDWLQGATADRVKSTVLGRASPGAVVVLHVSPAATARAMPGIVDTLRDRGYELVTVSELAGSALCARWSDGAP